MILTQEQGAQVLWLIQKFLRESKSVIVEGKVVDTYRLVVLTETGDEGASVVVFEDGES
jgi:hypothetical protein